jgi:hypothetical protein
MSLVRITVLIVIAGLVTPPCVLLIPRARKSTGFDRVLWLATWLLAFLGAWTAPGYITLDSTLNPITVAQVPVITTLFGALAGALSVNLLLWLLDRFDPPPIEENPQAEEPAKGKEWKVGRDSTTSDRKH